MYITSTQLETHLQTSFNTASKSQLDDVIIPAFEAWVNNYIGGSFDDDNPAVTVKKDGKGLPAVWSNHLDITEVKDDDKVIDADDYVLTETHVVKKTDEFGDGVQNIELTGTKRNVPPEVKAAMLYLVGKVLQPSKVSGATEEKYMDYTIKYSGEVETYVDSTVTNLLGKYRAINV